MLKLLRGMWGCAGLGLIQGSLAVVSYGHEVPTLHPEALKLYTLNPKPTLQP